MLHSITVRMQIEFNVILQPMARILHRNTVKKYFGGLGPYLVRFFLNLLWRSCKVVSIDGEEGLAEHISSKTPFIPIYWHQHQLQGAFLMRRLANKGANIGFLVSASSDGDLAAKIPESWGMTVIRGSSTHTGARAMRDLYQVVMKEKVSPVTTPDGPKGPPHVFKHGAIMLAQLTQIKLVPISWAASSYWQTKTWDKLVIPKPFSKIAFCIGEPVGIDKSLPKDKLEEKCELMTALLGGLQVDAQKALLRK